MTQSDWGVRIWIRREYLLDSPFKFQVGSQGSSADKKGEGEQNSTLWNGGKVRFPAKVVDADTELLIKYYRRAFEKAHEIYKIEKDLNTASIPKWRFLDSLPSKCVLQHSKTAV